MNQGWLLQRHSSVVKVRLGRDGDRLDQIECRVCPVRRKHHDVTRALHALVDRRTALARDHVRERATVQQCAAQPTDNATSPASAVPVSGVRGEAKREETKGSEGK